VGKQFLLPDPTRTRRSNFLPDPRVYPLPDAKIFGLKINEVFVLVATVNTESL